MSTLSMKNYEPEVIVDIENLSNEDWLDYRRQGIGGSDVAAIMGISPFATAQDLYYDKIGVKPVIEEDTNNWVALEVGHRLEDLVAKIFSVKTGLEVFPIRKMFRHPDYPFMLADVDYFIRFPDGGTGILECKTTNYNCQDKWADGQIPDNYIYQVRHYLAVMNLDCAYIACLYGNNADEFFIRKIERDMDEEQEIIEQEEYFWNEYVQKKVVPPLYGKPDLILNSIRRFTGNGDKALPELRITISGMQKLDRYLELAEEKSALDSRKREIETEQKQLSIPIVQEMGQTCKAVVEGVNCRYRITYNPTKRTQIGKEQIEKLKIQHPDIFTEYAKTSESRVFRVKKEEA